MRIKFFRASMGQRCPHCGALIDCFGRAGSVEMAPNPGDPIVCLKCGNVNTTVADGVLCPVPEAVVATYPADVLAEVRKAQRQARHRRPMVVEEFTPSGKHHERH